MGRSQKINRRVDQRGDWRAEVEQVLGYGLSDDGWQIFARDSLTEIESGAMTATQAVDVFEARAREMRSALAPADDRVDRERPSGRAATTRINALSAIYAAWAEKDPNVKWFRSNYLIEDYEYATAAISDDPLPNYRLLTEDEVVQWILARHDEDEFKNPNLCLFVLGYIQDRQERRLSVARPGVLGRLAKLADELADRYCWAPCTSTMFVLTGRTPEVFVYQGAASVRGGQMGSATRVTMTLDPSLTPQQVAGIYARLRQRLAPGDPPKSQGLRRYLLSQHVGPHVEIGYERVADRTGPGRRPQPRFHGMAYVVVPAGGHTWPNLRESWNQRYGNQTDEQDRSLAYPATSASNFITHAKDAILHLLFPGWRWDS